MNAPTGRPRWAAGRRALPEFPWDRIALFGATARMHPDGIVDLSVGTPVDPTPPLVQQALREAADAPGYPYAAGSADLLDALRGWLARTCGCAEDVAVAPSIGSKELVGLLPWLLGLGPGDVVIVPPLAYPTYAVGALLVGATVSTHWRDDAALVWLNSPSNPTGAVTAPAELADSVAQARAVGALVVSDECYLEFGYDGVRPVSVLSPEVAGGSLAGIIALHSLSKRSNLAGYRFGSVAGDPLVIGGLLELRRHAGLLVPGPVQAAAAAALRDDEHVHVQRERYAARRAVLRPALEAAGFTVSGSSAGLYLWATRGEGCLTSVGWLADRGILVAPGDFYGTAGAEHVRVALTATDERVAAAAARLG
ncbi:MAG TPA: succinyldiaminopimelate transaminase [Mycobacteriales bacterium]|nr:succinyldiaminopimelate transaminase [Mycobacteriales bacterium]